MEYIKCGGVTSHEYTPKNIHSDDYTDRHILRGGTVVGDFFVSTGNKQRHTHQTAGRHEFGGA
jgi:hypothetical protein